MTDQCLMCHRFIKAYGEDHCDRCLELLIVEGEEAEVGIGTGSIISGRFGTKYFCRHSVGRINNGPMYPLTFLTEAAK